MKHPNTDRIREIFGHGPDSLRSFVAAHTPPGIEFNVDMENVDIEAGVFDVFRTPCCHGGWLAVYFGLWDAFGRCDYRIGASRLAREIGLSDEEGLEDWAAQNPGLWGNEHGEWMFNPDFCAFGDEDRRYGDFATDIADWWMAVADRIDALKNGQNETTERVEV